jgi:two-component system, NtrC family, sensor kinase
LKIVSLSNIHKMKSKTLGTFFNRYLRFRSSIYARVVFIITLMSVFLFASFGIIFRSVHEQYLDTVIRQNGNNIGSIVEGALYQSMLTNDEGALQSTLDVIHTMSGIDEVNMYDDEDRLVYSSFSSDTSSHGNPNCINCHTNITSMFSLKEKSYRIIDVKSTCSMNQTEKGYRQLMIRSPILNERSCYTSSCHAHQPEEEVLGSLLIKIPLNDLDAAVRKSSTEFFLLAIFTTLALALILIIFTRKNIKNPLKAIIKASEAVSKGDNTIRVEIKHNQLDDMRMVSNAFNNMLDNINTASIELQNWSHQLEYKVQKKSEELLDAQNELIHIEKIASLGKLSSSVAHEINNPLSGVLTYTKLIQKQLSKAELDETVKQSMMKHLKVIETETKRCGDIVKGLLDFSRKDQEHFNNQNLNKVLKETYDLMAHQMKMENIVFTSNFAAQSDLVYCSENQIKQACVAILVNASEAVLENGEVHIRTYNPDTDNVRIEITDNGSGIAPDDIPHIFEPFFSAKHKTSGIGLGLAIAHGIVISHKGKIEVDSKLGKGTIISVILPLVKN